MLKELWKQSEALGTVFADKYRFDPLLRTQINVVSLLVVFSLFMLFILGVLLEYVYRDVTLAVVSSVRAGILEGPGAQAHDFFTSLSEIRTATLAGFSFVIAIATITFGYLLTRIALAPTKNALESQKQFIGDIAHELRTPLSTIKTNTEVALFDAHMKPELRGILVSNVEELDRISGIINNLLSFSAYFRRDSIAFAPIELGVVVENVLQKLKRLIDRKQLEIVTSIGGRQIVRGNDVALEQIVTNIVKNAIIYTPENGRIGIMVDAQSPDTIILQVQDTGIGIPQKDLPRILEPYYRSERSRSRAFGGTGLGLAIVNELVKLHDGTISIRSSEGRGTTVTVCLPAAEKNMQLQEVGHNLTLHMETRATRR